MNNERSGEILLDRIYKVAQIFALIVLPIVVAVVGWVAQKSLTDTSTRKDYVQMALQVLREPRRADDGEIRKWANEVIGQNSPIPFSSKAGEQLSTSALGMLRSNPLLIPSMEKREKCPLIDLSNMPREQAPAVAALQRLCNRNGTDLFWMQIYMGLLEGSSDGASATPKQK